MYIFIIILLIVIILSIYGVSLKLSELTLVTRQNNSLLRAQYNLAARANGEMEID